MTNGYPGYSMREIALEILRRLRRPATAREISNQMDEYKYAPTSRQVDGMFRVAPSAEPCRVNGKKMWRFCGERTG